MWHAEEFKQVHTYYTTRAENLLKKMLKDIKLPKKDILRSQHKEKKPKNNDTESSIIAQKPTEAIDGIVSADLISTIMSKVRVGNSQMKNKSCS